jgi:hypothetical protein
MPLPLTGLYVDNGTTRHGTVWHCIAKGGRGGKTNLQCPCCEELKWSHKGRRGEARSRIIVCQRPEREQSRSKKPTYSDLSSGPGPGHPSCPDLIMTYYCTWFHLSRRLRVGLALSNSEIKSKNATRVSGDSVAPPSRNHHFAHFAEPFCDVQYSAVMMMVMMMI